MGEDVAAYSEREQWLIDRKSYIGASECAAVLGLSRYRSPLEVWSQKTGLVDADDLDDVEAVQLGIELEDYVAKRFEKKTGKKVHRVNQVLRHKDYPFIGCNLDRRVVGESAVLECKTTGTAHADEWKGDEIPMDYLLQVQHQLAVTGYDKGYIAVLIGNREFKWKEIPRDEEIISTIEMKLKDFWNNFVVPHKMPEVGPLDKDILEKLFPQAKYQEPIQLPRESESLLKDIELWEEQKNVVEKEIAEKKNKLKAILGENELGIIGDYKIVWRNVHKEPYQVKASDFRMFKITKQEKEK